MAPQASAPVGTLRATMRFPGRSCGGEMDPGRSVSSGRAKRGPGGRDDEVSTEEVFSGWREFQISIAILPAGAQLRGQIRASRGPVVCAPAAASQDDGGAPWRIR